MLVYYFGLCVGFLLVIFSVYSFIQMYRKKTYPFIKIGKASGAIVLGTLILIVFLPSLKYMLFKEYDVVKGKCVIEVDSAGRSTMVDFIMQNSNDIYSFKEIPQLDAYGRNIPYYCAITVTKDHMWEISYAIYDINTKELIVTSN
ncbi:hypothetical protein NQZ71_22715 (plasmid) [Niallia taxi]|uniref:hypothetical protein n=2 Tax=Niallia taxi TaxID=2499688 RepID=UPI0021A46B24|nr:hypothetical protein [Niallia taxi]MCT2346106.1 hypothetical protein [Niallia taxi]WOD65977.1 hypothetical protein NQZ71_22715 [Niallia taxi]